MIKTVRRAGPRPSGTRVDPTAVREPARPQLGACLACASGSRVAKHTHPGANS